MWQKFVASACVMTGALGFGWALCQEMRCDIWHLKLQKQMLLYMIGEIAYLHRPLEEIFDIIVEKIEPPYDAFLSEISWQMGQRDGRSLMDIWRGTVAQMRRTADIPAVGAALLEQMGDCFACEGGELQIGALELFGQGLEDEIARRTAKKDENSKLIKALSTLTGILCIILFL